MHLSYTTGEGGDNFVWLRFLQANINHAKAVFTTDWMVDECSSCFSVQGMKKVLRPLYYLRVSNLTFDRKVKGPVVYLEVCREDVLNLC